MSMQKSQIDKEELRSLNLLRCLGLIGSAELLEKVSPINELATTYSTYTELNSRNYFLLKALMEVQKAGFAMGRWIKHIESSTVDADGKFHVDFDDMEIESLIDEQSVWQRKLFEVLIALICFSKHNHISYYYHYFLLKDFEHYQNLRKEQRDFFHEKNNYRDNVINTLQGKIIEAEKLINEVAECWYLQDAKRGSNKIQHQLVSVRKALLKALKIARPGEKTSLGYTYEKTFAEASRNIHFNPMRVDFDDTLGRFKFGMAQCASLLISILQRAQQLSGYSRDELKYSVDKTEVKDQRPPTKSIAAVGDFVLAGGLYLAEVLEVKANIFDYESYRVKYLDERPVEEIDEDWLPAFNVQLYQDRQSLMMGLEAKLRDTQEQEISEQPTFSIEEKIEAIRDAAIMTWKLAMKDYFRNTYKDHLERIARLKW
jgi:hypothetical protein